MYVMNSDTLTATTRAGVIARASREPSLMDVGAALPWMSQGCVAASLTTHSLPEACPDQIAGS